MTCPLITREPNTGFCSALAMSSCDLPAVKREHLVCAILWHSRERCDEGSGQAFFTLKQAQRFVKILAHIVISSSGRVLVLLLSCSTDMQYQRVVIPWLRSVCAHLCMFKDLHLGPSKARLRPKGLTFTTHIPDNHIAYQQARLHLGKLSHHKCPSCLFPHRPEGNSMHGCTLQLLGMHFRVASSIQLSELLPSISELLAAWEAWTKSTLQPEKITYINFCFGIFPKIYISVT